MFCCGCCWCDVVVVVAAVVVVITFDPVELEYDLNACVCRALVEAVPLVIPTAATTDDDDDEEYDDDDAGVNNDILPLELVLDCLVTTGRRRFISSMEDGMLPLPLVPVVDICLVETMVSVLFDVGRIGLRSFVCMVFYKK